MHARNLSRARARSWRSKRKEKEKEKGGANDSKAMPDGQRMRPAGLALWLAFFSRCGEPRSAGVAGRRRHGNPRKVQGGPGYQRNQGIRAASESSCMRPVAKVAVSTSVKH